MAVSFRQFDILATGGLTSDPPKKGCPDSHQPHIKQQQKSSCDHLRHRNIGTFDASLSQQKLCRGRRPASRENLIPHHDADRPSLPWDARNVYVLPPESHGADENIRQCSLFRRNFARVEELFHGIRKFTRLKAHDVHVRADAQEPSLTMTAPFQILRGDVLAESASLRIARLVRRLFSCL